MPCAFKQITSFAKAEFGCTFCMCFAGELASPNLACSTLISIIVLLILLYCYADKLCPPCNSYVAVVLCCFVLLTSPHSTVCLLHIVNKPISASLLSAIKMCAARLVGEHAQLSRSTSHHHTSSALSQQPYQCDEV